MESILYSQTKKKNLIQAEIFQPFSEANGRRFRIYVHITKVKILNLNKKDLLPSLNTTFVEWKYGKCECIKTQKMERSKWRVGRSKDATSCCHLCAINRRDQWQSVQTKNHFVQHAQICFFFILDLFNDDDEDDDDDDTDDYYYDGC